MHRTRPLAPAIAAIAASLSVLTIFGAPPAQAQIEACSGVAAIEPGLADLTGASRPNGEQPEALRFPAPADVSGAAVSFWDYVPDEFFVALHAPREQVEAMGTRDWIEAVTRWNRLQRGLRNSYGASVPASTFFEIDWMFAMARTGEAVSPRDWIEQGIGSDVEVDPTVDGARLVAEAITDDRLWLMVAGIYAQQRLALPALFQPASAASFDAYWQAFPDGSGAAPNGVERDRLRRYLCNHPSTRLLQLEAAAAEPESRQRAEAELSAYIESSLADFDAVVSFLRPGVASNDWLDLVPQDSIRTALRDAVIAAGPAKSYLLLKETLYESIAGQGEVARKQAIWRALPGYAQFLWPDPCLSAAVYPSADSPLFGPPWVMQTPCSSPVQARSALRLAIQERQP